jgi:hypothetical protein
VSNEDVPVELMGFRAFAVVKRIAASVIASEAKQSMPSLRSTLDCFVACAPRNDGENDNERVSKRRPA